MRQPWIAMAMLLTAWVVGTPPPLAAQATAAGAEAREVRFPGRGEPGDQRFDFSAELLALVLERGGGGWTLTVVEGMKQPRALQAARQGDVDVVALPNLASDRSRLIVVRKPQAQLAREELLAFYEGKIAKWWTPDDVIFVDAIPLGATGKIQKNRLREQFGDHLIGRRP